MTIHSTPPAPAHRRPNALLRGVLAAVSLSLVPSVAAAKPRVSRQGLQVEGLIGGSNCLPGRAACRTDSATLSGATRASIGGGAALGWRARPWLLVGAMYRGGGFRPDYEIVGGGTYSRGAQHSAFGFVRPILPIWRLDIGVNLAPGYSRQIFGYSGGDQDYTQGFAFALGPVVDIFVTKHVFVGFQADFILNAHRRVCEVRDRTTQCVESSQRYPNPVHQAIYGFHFGFTAL